MSISWGEGELTHGGEALLLLLHGSADGGSHWLASSHINGCLLLPAASTVLYRT